MRQSCIRAASQSQLGPRAQAVPTCGGSAFAGSSSLALVFLLPLKEFVHFLNWAGLLSFALGRPGLHIEPACLGCTLLPYVEAYCCVASAQAIEHCTRRGLAEDFLDACVYDVLATNDTKTFVEASADTQVEVMEADREVEEENEEFIRREYESASSRARRQEKIWNKGLLFLVLTALCRTSIMHKGI